MDEGEIWMSSVFRIFQIQKLHDSILKRKKNRAVKRKEQKFYSKFVS